MTAPSLTQRLIKEKITEDFIEKFGEGGEIRTYFAPGRVNLIGDHTDYNGGAAMPAALTLGTYFAVRLRDDDKLRFYSVNFPDAGITECTVKDLKNEPGHGWANYPKGIIWAYKEKGFEIPNGADILLYGTLPDSSGLSSSASVEVGTAYALADMFGIDIGLEEIAKLGQFSENNFNGVNCGIMDQFAIAMGKEDNAVFLKTSPLDYEYVNADLGDNTLIIAASNKKRGLGDSKYNERRAECEKALEELKEVIEVNSLGELTEEQFEEHIDAIKSPVRQKRARHAVSENIRTIKAKEALNGGDLEEFGRLMTESHNSLRDDYEVTGAELDALVESALKQKGVLGSRMTGAGFGGCTVSLVKKENADGFIKKVGEEYLDKIGYSADFYEVTPGDGPQRI